MIPRDFLADYVAQYEVTPGELEVIAAALEGQSIAKIAFNLAIQPNAVRKRLGEAYRKFEILGKGPGKFVKLQQHLISAYQAQTAKKKIVLVWSGEVGKLIAQGFKRTIFKHPQLEVSLATQDLAAMSWQSRNQTKLDHVHLVICCLSSITSAMHFNLGWLLGRIQEVKLLNFQAALPEFLADLNSINAHKPAELQNLLQSLIGRSAGADWLDYQLQPWQNVLCTVAAHTTTDIADRNWSQVAHSVEQSLKALSQNQYILENSCFGRIMLHSLAEINHQLETLSSHLIPASHYPRYLSSLQKRSPITIKALTLVEQNEDFWQREMGSEMPSTTQINSVGVFAFTTPRVFERNFTILLAQGAKYSVRVVSQQKLSQDFPEYCKSFGIIIAPGGKLLTEYVIQDGVKYVRFDAKPETIEHHEQILNNIINSAVEVERTPYLPESDVILSRMRQIRDLVFERSRFAVKSVGISQYLNIENYDRWGQSQDFYPQLVQQMLAIFQQHHNPHHQSVRILEVGAKTGHFTQHLSEIKADIWALELDWVCFKKLKNRLDHNKDRINLEHKDSCAYDPPYQFDYIFSCLGDRQIDFADKEKYLKNIKRNLKPNGLFIVGDEFLPPYEYQDNHARQTAIERYHQQRLSWSHQPEIQALNREMADCALNHQGDYKLSCDRYEHLLAQAGFSFKQEQVNNAVYEQVGGVFVYRAWLEP
ncbi:MAG: methyltransferase domain-containing protein [Cyanobacteria bacterium J06582_2]